MVSSFRSTESQIVTVKSILWFWCQVFSLLGIGIVVILIV